MCANVLGPREAALTLPAILVSCAKVGIVKRSSFSGTRSFGLPGIVKVQTYILQTHETETKQWDRLTQMYAMITVRKPWICSIDRIYEGQFIVIVHHRHNTSTGKAMHGIRWSPLQVPYRWQSAMKQDK